MSRDPDRILRTLIKISELWRLEPDLRLGQIMMILAKDDSLFNLEDDVLVERIEQRAIELVLLEREKLVLDTEGWEMNPRDDEGNISAGLRIFKPEIDNEAK